MNNTDFLLRLLQTTMGISNTGFEVEKYLKVLKLHPMIYVIDVRA